MHALEIRSLTVQYGKRRAVDELSLTAASGEILGMLGPNGAGKSTTLLSIAGSLAASAGEIRIAGQDLSNSPLDCRRNIGFADQPPSLYEFLTVAEHLEFVGASRGHKDLDAQRALLDDLGLADIADRLCRELSFGMRQRVGLAAALIGDLKLVLLDETLNGLDPKAAKKAREALTNAAKEGVAVVMSTHLLGVAERLCDRIVIVNAGRVVKDLGKEQLAELLNQGPGALENLYLESVD